MIPKLVIFIYTCHVFDMVSSTGVPLPNITDTTVMYSSVSASSPHTIDTCKLVPKLPNAGETIAGLANSDKQLVKITVTIREENGTFAKKETRLKNWVISTSLTGKSMLMLKENFDSMSLYTLGLGVEFYSVTLTQEPTDCLIGKKVEEIENILRIHFLNNFGAIEHALPSGAEICNKDIGKKESNRDRLVYVCCKLNQENQLQCSELTTSIWIQLLFISIIILQVLIILYSPVYMPGFMYKAKSIFQKFAYRTDPENSLQLKLKVVTDSSNVDNGYFQTECQSFTHLRTFRMELQTLAPDEVHTLTVKGIDMCVRDSKIVSEGNAPVSFLTFVRDFFVRCNLRYDISSVGDCCKQDMWVKLPCKVVFRWYQCLSGIMVLLSVVLFASPWLLRVWFYYSIEEETIQHQKEVYEKFSLKIPYPGNLVTYLSPTHTLFIVIYCVIGVEIFTYIVFPGAVKEKVKFTVRKCFRDTRDKSKLDACGMMASHMLRPLKLYGIIGCIVLPLWLIVLPLYIIAILFEVIPIANLTVRLLVNLVFYISKVINPNIFRRNDQQVPGKFSQWMEQRFKTILVVDENEANTRLNKLLHTFVLIMTFITVWLFLVLVIECIAFYVECAVYALVGFILNPKFILKYVSLILLIAVYGNECFGGVHDRYVAYSIGISSEVQGMVGDKLTEEAAKSSDEQQNIALRVPAKNDIPERLCLVTGPEGFLKWKVSRLALFLDKNDTPYIPTSFLFQMAKLNNFQCPGLVHILYLKALLDFLLIVLFLIFVFIVIFAFGQADDISSAGQAIAALGTGFFPLILKRFLFQSQAYSLDRSNLHWKTMFANAVQRYAEKWNFEDIIVAKVDETEIDPETNISLTVCSETNHVEDDTFTDIYITEDKIGDEVSEKVCSFPTKSADLIVKRSKNSDGDDTFTFYVPTGCFETDSLYTEEDTLL